MLGMAPCKIQHKAMALARKKKMKVGQSLVEAKQISLAKKKEEVDHVARQKEDEVATAKTK